MVTKFIWQICRVLIYDIVYYAVIIINLRVQKHLIHAIIVTVKVYMTRGDKGLYRPSPEKEVLWHSTYLSWDQHIHFAAFIFPCQVPYEQLFYSGYIWQTYLVSKNKAKIVVCTHVYW